MYLDNKTEKDPKEYQQAVDWLVAYNTAQTRKLAEEAYKELAISLKDDTGELLGAIFGRNFWGTLEIKTFVIAPEHRKKGLGKQLLCAAEDEARKRHCRYVSLDTFSFQAPEFYEKMGYQKIGEEKDFPRNHSKYYYRKTL